MSNVIIKSWSHMSEAARGAGVTETVYGTIDLMAELLQTWKKLLPEYMFYGDSWIQVTWDIANEHHFATVSENDIRYTVLDTDENVIIFDKIIDLFGLVPLVPGDYSAESD